ncbi:MAG: amidohydrolase [Chloroflexi bacterium]|nr:amidohydrolase [Chloroflexota bacterium]
MVHPGIAADLKKIVSDYVSSHGEPAIDLARTALSHPETGYKEVKTAAATAAAIRTLGLYVREDIAVTGMTATIKGGSPGPNIAILAELDALPVPGHPNADPETTAAHACAHHCQLGNMLAAAIGLQAPGVLDSLSGSVTLMVVPAEEYVEIEWRNEQRKAGRIEFLGGKPEFVRLGELDDVDICMMTHVTTEDPHDGFGVFGANTGLVAKFINYRGVKSHAGGAPHLGVNALNAAHLAIAGIHAQRETYRDDDTIRVHPIITRGGSVVNAVPDDVRMETFVRGATINAIRGANEKVDRALRAGALAVGATVDITTLPGYLPLAQDRILATIHRANAEALVGPDLVHEFGMRGGSTDMGDLTQIMPGIHPYVGGAVGRSNHAEDMVVDDYNLAVLDAGKAMAMTVVDLLSNNAAEAMRVISGHKPAMTKDEYLALQRAFLSERSYTE